MNMVHRWGIPYFTAGFTTVHPEGWGGDRDQPGDDGALFCGAC